MYFELDIYDSDRIQAKTFLTWDNIEVSGFYENMKTKYRQNINPSHFQKKRETKQTFKTN